MSGKPRPARFLFNRDLLAPEKPEPKEPEVIAEPMITVREHQQLLAEAEARGHEKGRKQGLSEIADKESHRVAEEAAKLVTAVRKLLKNVEDQQSQYEKDAVGLAFLAARRFASHLISREPLGEVVALLSECLGPLRRQPHVVIRIHERDSDRLQKAVDAIVYEKGFEGRLVILGEPELERGDCKIEWADGGLVRDTRSVEEQIEKAMRRYFTARDNALNAGEDDSSSGNAGA